LRLTILQLSQINFTADLIFIPFKNLNNKLCLFEMSLDFLAGQTKLTKNKEKSLFFNAIAFI